MSWDVIAAVRAQVADIFNNVEAPNLCKAITVRKITLSADLDPTTGDPTTTTEGVEYQALIRPYTDREIELLGSKYKSGDLNVSVMKADMDSGVETPAFEISVGDQVLIGGNVYQIADLKQRDLVGIIEMQASL